MPRYAPGTGLLLVARDSVVLVEDTADADDLHADLGAASPVGAVLDRLTRAGLSSAPSFALLVGSTLVLRGAAVAVVEAGGTKVDVTADGAATWREHRLTGDARVCEMRLAGHHVRWLPLTGGAVLASAVRPDEPGGPAAPDTATATAVRPVEPAVGAVAEPADGALTAPTRVADALPVQVPAPPAAEPTAQEPGPADVAPLSTPALISEVPLRPPSSAPVSEPTLVEVPADDYDHLFGHTVVRTVEDAAVRPAEAPAVEPVAASDPDHDGHTVLASELRARRAAASPPVSAAAAEGPTVLAVRCPAGHVNRPGAGACRSCGVAVVQDVPLPVARPSLGRLVGPDGVSVELDRTVLVGRAPEVQRVSATELPHLMTVASPQQDVSRNHLEVRVEGWDLLAVDVSSNGTVLTRPGQPPRRLHPGEPTLVFEGSSFDLGDGVVIALELPR